MGLVTVIRHILVDLLKSFLMTALLKTKHKRLSSVRGCSATDSEKKQETKPNLFTLFMLKGEAVHSSCGVESDAQLHY